MCGLVAIFSYGNDSTPVCQEELLTIRDAMFNRGPDGCGSWFSVDNRVGLGHRRLSIIDVSDDGRQPMAARNGSVQLVFNGEIYNFAELRRELMSKGHIFKSKSDSEVIIVGWLEWGEEVVHRLNGMFSFVIYDATKNGVFIARDPFGIKPLYIADDGQTIRVASQVKALMSGGNVSSQPSSAGHVGFYLWGSVPEPYTMYRDIFSFPAGTSKWIDCDGRTHETQFASITGLIKEAEEKSYELTEKAKIERLYAALSNSMAKHLVADVPIGVFLSAGIDSCALAAFAKEQNASLRTLTLGFEEYQGTQQDETLLALDMAKILGSKHTTTWVRSTDYNEMYQSFLNSMDQPTIDGLNTWFVCKAAKEAGLKVALSGLGGDELLAGYPSFKQIPRLVNGVSSFGRIGKIIGVGARKLSSPWISKFASSKYSGVLEYGGTVEGAYLLRRGLVMPWELTKFLPDEVVREGLPLVLNSFLQQEQQQMTMRGEISALETSVYMRNQLLRDADWASMAHSIELRVPLVDLDVLTACSTMTKTHLANSSRPALPDCIKNRSKTGFSIPVVSWSASKGKNAERGVVSLADRIFRDMQAS